MTSAQVLDLKGNKVREVNLADDVFGIEPNKGLLHTALVRQLANARSGSANTKTRSEVAGGGKKPWRQKGTGRARAGSIRSPLWEGGGVAFGPKPRDYSITLPKKQRVLALKSALAAQKDNLMVLQGFNLKEGKTKEMAASFKELKVEGKKVLLLLDYADAEHSKVELAARNIAGVKVLNISNLNVKDLLESEVILTTEGTVESLNKRFQPKPKSEEKVAEKKAKSESKASAAKAPKKAASEKAAKDEDTKAPKAKAKKAE